MSIESDDAAWARAHRACFQVGPLVEMRGSQKIQVGFTIDLYAALPVDKAAGAERSEGVQAPLGAPAHDHRVAPPAGGEHGARGDRAPADRGLPAR